METRIKKKESKKHQPKRKIYCPVIQELEKVNKKIPKSILENKFLNEMIKLIPSNYNFEIHKSIWRIQEIKKALKKEEIRLVLQMPQGLQMFACALSDIFEHFTQSEVKNQQTLISR